MVTDGETFAFKQLIEDRIPWVNVHLSEDIHLLSVPLRIGGKGLEAIPE
jgi:hypothetical protein